MNVVDKIDAQIDKRLPQTPEAIRKRRNRILIPMAAIAAGAVVVFGGKAAFEHFSEPTFSSETTNFTFTQEQNDLWSAAQEIEGLGDPRDGVAYIESMPENKEALDDGIQLGETISIPVSANK